MENHSLSLEILKGTYCITKGLTFEHIHEIQAKSEFFSMTKTPEEFSVVCHEAAIPLSSEIYCERDWKVLKVAGPLDFSLIGILSNISTLLQKASISLFVVSTYNTDYILIKASNVTQAISALRQGGHIITFE